MNRRSFLAAVPAVAMAPVATMLPVVSMAAPAITGQVIEEPFLHVLDGPIPGTHYSLQAGDMVLVLPGAGPWDDMHLLRDGRFAAVQVFNPCGKVVEVRVYGSDERFYVPKEQAGDVIAGRVSKRIRLDRGRWVD